MIRGKKVNQPSRSKGRFSCFLIPTNKKKGFQASSNLIVFLILNALFFLLMFGVVVKFGTNASFYEQINAKKIALIIDGAEPGTTVSLNLGEFRSFVEDGRVDIKQIVSIENNLVTVSLSESKGYSFRYVSDYEVEYSWDVNNGYFLNILILEEEENE